MYKKKITNKLLLSTSILIGSFLILLFLSSDPVFSQNTAEDTAFSVGSDSLDNSEEYMDLDNVIVVYKDGKKKRVKVNEEQIQNNLTDEERVNLNIEKRNNLAKKADELKTNSNVAFVQPNYYYKLDSWTRSGAKDTPNDFLTSPTASTGRHWYYERSGIREVWHNQDCFNGGSGCGGNENVVVAVIDTGLAYETRTSAYGDTFVANNDMFGVNNINLFTNNDEIPNNGIDDDLNGYVDDYHGLNAGIAISCANSGTCSASQRAEEGKPHDDGGHGTYVTGLISSLVDNGFASVSPAFNVTIMPLKATFPYSGFLGTLEIEASINYAIDNGADVINMSWGGSTPDKIVKDALEDAYNAGIILVAATGNDNDPIVDYPARYHNGQVINFGMGNETINFDVTAVGAVTSSNSRAGYSNYGSNLDVVAYVGNGGGSGDAVYQRTYLCFYQVPNCYSSKDYDGGFANGFGNGTSFAAPQVSALYALLRSMKPDLTVAAAEEYLINNVVDVGTSGYDNLTGWGVINFLNSTMDLADDILPTISMIEPDGVEVADQTFMITWDDYDFDDDAEINLYWDTDSTGFDGTIISECSKLSENSDVDQCEFYTAGLLPQVVYIYGCIEDDNSGPICDYAAGSINITHPDGILRDSGKTIVNKDLKTINFETAFTSKPIVIAQISSGLGSDMAYVNIGSVSNSGFTISLEENVKTGYDNNIAPQEVSWYALQTVSTDEQIGITSLIHEWKTVTFPEAFLTAPKVLTSLQTNLGSDIAHVSVRNITTSGFEMKVTEAPGLDGIHTTEYVGWVAFEDITGAQYGTVNANNNWMQVTFSSPYSEPPTLVFSPNTSNGADQYLFDIQDLTASGFQVRVEEDRSYDGIHTTEKLSWLAFDYTHNSTSSGTVLLNHNLVVIPFPEPFTEVPIIIADVNSEKGTDTIDIDIRAVSNHFFVMRIEEDLKGKWDGLHTYETVTWYATIPNNDLPNQAKFDTTNHNWKTINFPNAFTSVPYVFADIQTEYGKDTIGIDIRNITTTSFEVRLDEDVKLGWDGLHTFEKIGWIAFENPPAGLANKISVNGSFQTVTFSSPFATIPKLLFDRQIKKGGDSVLVDVRNLTTTGFQIRVEEEPKFYDGIHTYEQVVWWAFE